MRASSTNNDEHMVSQAVLELRGALEIKGKGLMVTYCLDSVPPEDGPLLSSNI